MQCSRVRSRVGERQPWKPCASEPRAVLVSCPRAGECRARAAATTQRVSVTSAWRCFALPARLLSRALSSL